MLQIVQLLFIAACLSSVLLPSFGESVQWEAKFEPEKLFINMNSDNITQLTLKNIPNDMISQNYVEMQLVSQNKEIVSVDDTFQRIDLNSNSWSGNITVFGIFLGQSEVYVKLRTPNSDNKIEQAKQNLNVIVTRQRRVLDHIFSVTVAVFVLFITIAFGSVIDLKLIKKILLRPIGPAIGLTGQFLLMPLISFSLGLLIFPNAPELALGLFFTGIAPGGGASNIFTVVLNGNLDLSICMTTISTFFMFGTMPLWLFTLGKIIFDKAKVEIPYMKVFVTALTLLIPLGIGVLVQKFLPRLTKMIAKVIQPVSFVAILVITILFCFTNYYLLELFSWKIILAGFCLPTFGYIFAYIIATLLRQSPADCITIGIETGIQNIMITLYLLQALEQPMADITVVVPIACGISIKFLLIALKVGQVIKNRYFDGGREVVPLDEVKEREMDVMINNDFKTKEIK